MEKMVKLKDSDDDEDEDEEKEEDKDKKEDKDKDEKDGDDGQSVPKTVFINSKIPFQVLKPAHLFILVIFADGLFSGNIGPLVFPFKFPHRLAIRIKKQMGVFALELEISF